MTSFYGLPTGRLRDALDAAVSQAVRTMHKPRINDPAPPRTLRRSPSAALDYGR